MALLKNFIKNFKGGPVVVFLVFIGATILIFWPALFGGKIINDYFGLDLAHYRFTGDFVSGINRSNLRLWWDNYLGGFPVYLTQVGFFSPLVFVLSLFLSGFSDYNWLIFLNFLFGGLAMYWFARNLHLTKTASYLAGLAYVFSQNNLYWGATLPFINVYLFIPLFFLAILKIARGKQIWWIFGGLISAYGLAAGETQIVFYTFIVGFFWALFLSFRSKNFKSIYGYFSFGIIGSALASFWILPVLNYLKFTARGEALSFADLAYDFMRIADPLRFFYPYMQLPQFTGFESLGIVPNYYIGTLTIFLALAAVFLIKKNKQVAFWIGVASFSLLIRAKWTGVFWLIHFLPGFDRFRGVFHWSYISSFALALLAGFALDNLDQIKESGHFKKFVKGLKIFGWINLTVFAGVFFASLSRNKILGRIFQFFDEKIYPSKQLPLEHYHAVITSEFNKFLDAFSFSNYHFLISLAVILVAILLFVLYQKGKINFNNFKKIALVFVFLNITLIWQGYYDFISRSKITNYPDTVKFIKNYDKSGEQYRFFRFYPPESYQQFEVFSINDWTDYKLKTMESNIGVYFDMDTFGGVEPFLSERVANVFNEIGFERPTTISDEPWLRSTKLSLNDKISRFSSKKNLNLLSMLNIKYVFSSFKLPNFKLIYQTTATKKNIPVYIYENPDVMPRIYFAKNVKFIDPESAFEGLLKVKDFHELTLIEHDKISKPDFKNSSKPDFDILEFKPEYVKIKTSGNSGWLVYSDANLPTWEAYIDNQKTDIYTANYLFKSVFVPEGEHEVIFKYPGLWGQFKAVARNIIK